MIAWLGSVASAQGCLTPLLGNGLLWPFPGEATTPDAWILVELRDTEPDEIGLETLLGERVPFELHTLGRGLWRGSVHALAPEVPLTVGETYVVSGLAPGLYFSTDPYFVVEEGSVAPAVQPLPLSRWLVTDGEDDTTRNCENDEGWDRISYTVCSDSALVVGTIGEARPPGRLVGADLDYVGPGALIAFDAAVDVEPGEDLVVWLGAADARGDIAWRDEPDRFTMPEEGWSESTRAADGTTCSSLGGDWAGWGDTERTYWGPDDPPGSATEKGCAAAPGLRAGGVAWLVALAGLAGRSRRCSGRPAG